jgi:hypothetical protein
MLETCATTKTGGPLALLGLTPLDLDHLTANQPIALTPARLGLADRDTILLFETDPMISVYRPLPVTIILIRQSTIDAMRAGAPVPLDIHGVPLWMFYADDDAGLIAFLARLGLRPGRVVSDL